MARVDSFCCNYDVALVWPFRKPALVQGSLRFSTRDSLTLSKIKSAACWQKKITVPIHAFGRQTCKIERVQIRNCTPYGGHLMIVVMMCASVQVCVVVQASIGKLSRVRVVIPTTEVLNRY